MSDRIGCGAWVSQSYNEHSMTFCGQVPYTLLYMYQSSRAHLYNVGGGSDTKELAQLFCYTKFHKLPLNSLSLSLSLSLSHTHTHPQSQHNSISSYPRRLHSEA